MSVTENPGTPTLSAPVLAALEATWTAIQHRHPDLPAVVVLASGTVGVPRGAVRLGHFAAMRWAVEGARLPEVFVAGEGLGRGPVDILGTLLHEAVHALGHVRGIQDTSRQSRYHNRKFRDLAREVGLDVREVPVIGWSQTHVPEITITEYAVVIDALREALTIHRYSEGQVQSTTPPSLPWAPSPAPSAEPPSPPERSARCRLPRTSQPAASRAEGGDR